MAVRSPSPSKPSDPNKGSVTAERVESAVTDVDTPAIDVGPSKASLPPAKTSEVEPASGVAPETASVPPSIRNVVLPAVTPAETSSVVPLPIIESSLTDPPSV